MDQNQLKAKALGEPFGTAQNKLRKSLLYGYVVRSGDNLCYRCGEPISSIDQFSIEHKKAWMRQAEPRTAFFDETNIAYSHIKCNIGAAARIPAYIHGTEANYKQGCRCVECATAKRTSNMTSYRKNGRMRPSGKRTPPQK